MHGGLLIESVLSAGIESVDVLKVQASLLAATLQRDEASQSSSDNRNSPCEAMHVPRRCVELNSAQHGVGIRRLEEECAVEMCDNDGSEQHNAEDHGDDHGHRYQRAPGHTRLRQRQDVVDQPSQNDQRAANREKLDVER